MKNALRNGLYVGVAALGIGGTGLAYQAGQAKRDKEALDTIVLTFNGYRQAIDTCTTTPSPEHAQALDRASMRTHIQYVMGRNACGLAEGKLKVDLSKLHIDALSTLKNVNNVSPNQRGRMGYQLLEIADKSEQPTAIKLINEIYDTRNPAR